MQNFNSERMAMAAGCTAFARVCLDEAIAYAKQRETFGKPLAQHQVIRHKLVDMAQKVAATQAMLEMLAWRLDQGESPVAEICMLKNQATQTMAFCASEAVQIFGGAGFMRGIKVERIYREVKVNAIGGGSRGDHEGPRQPADGVVSSTPPARHSAGAGEAARIPESRAARSRNLRSIPGFARTLDAARRPGMTRKIRTMLFTADHDERPPHPAEIHRHRNQSPSSTNGRRRTFSLRTSCSRSSAISAFSGSTSRSSSAGRGSTTAMR